MYFFFFCFVFGFGFFFFVVVFVKLWQRFCSFLTSACKMRHHCKMTKSLFSVTQIEICRSGMNKQLQFFTLNQALKTFSQLALFINQNNNNELSCWRCYSSNHMFISFTWAFENLMICLTVTNKKWQDYNHIYSYNI